MKRKIKILVAFSGGKDSMAALLWTIFESGYKKENIEAVFCDTGWEHEWTYNYIHEVTDKLNVKLVTIRSKKYEGFVDLSKKKKRFPATKARFCTEELKIKPMIDYILDECNCHVVVIQGIRKVESATRAKMSEQCTYFRYYYEPYGYDKNGKPKFHYYRKKDVLDFRKSYLDDIIRPCFNWTDNEVIQYIFDRGFDINPLYYKGSRRVGCYPCIMCRQSEIKSMIEYQPEYIERLKNVENEVGGLFFSHKYIPERAIKNIDIKSGKKIPTVEDVVRYINDKNSTGFLFEEDQEQSSCSSYYSLCE